MADTAAERTATREDIKSFTAVIGSRDPAPQEQLRLSGTLGIGCTT